MHGEDRGLTKKMNKYRHLEDLWACLHNPQEQRLYEQVKQLEMDSQLYVIKLLIKFETLSRVPVT